ncbi:MAG: hypothetical protein IPI82_03620 [Candidatus Microthrix sp.]|nr:hypothetical protein [Candidatus Microthrix sp.]
MKRSHPRERPATAEHHGRARRQGEIAVGAVRSLASLLDPRRVPGVVRSVADTVAGAMRGGVETAPPMPLNGRVGPHRDVLWAAMSMPDLMSVKRAHGTTLNDVVLTVVTGAFGDPRVMRSRPNWPTSRHACWCRWGRWAGTIPGRATVSRHWSLNSRSPRLIHWSVWPRSMQR